MKIDLLGNRSRAEQKQRPIASPEDFLARVDIDPSDLIILPKDGAVDSRAAVGSQKLSLTDLASGSIDGMIVVR